MNIILLSGGSGKRLWPLSNDVRSKQFLKLLKNEDGSYQSMLQRVYKQLNESNIVIEDFIIATSESQKSSIMSQINDSVDIVVEPVRKDTFPAIALSCAKLLWENNDSPDSIVAILPVDMYADSEICNAIQQAAYAVENNLSDLLLVGVKPTFPTEKYGYIIPAGNISDNVLRVSHFQEKPSSDTAEKLIKQNALWNCGIFVCKLKYITDIIENKLGIHTFKELKEVYYKLPSISFDYAVVEKASSVAAVTYNNYWKDLGTWNTLTEEMSDNTMGNVTNGEGTNNTQIINELGIPVVVLGAENMVIAASPDGILVADKEKSSFLKKYLEGQNTRPMYEERSWGEYKVLEFNKHDDGISSLTKHMYVKKDASFSYQRHLFRDEIWTFVEGKGDLLIDGHTRNVSRGDVAYIKAGQMHSVRAVTPLHIIEVQIGKELIEEDIIKETWEW